MSENNNFTAETGSDRQDSTASAKSMDAQKIMALVSSVTILIVFVGFWFYQIKGVVTLLSSL